jgi:hypothetical protein
MPAFVRFLMWRVSDESSAGMTRARVSAMPDASAGGHQQSVDPAQRTRDPGTGEGGEPPGGSVWTIEPQHLVRESLNKIAAGRVGDDAPEARLTAALRPRDRGLCCPQQPIGHLDGSPDTFAVVHRLIMARSDAGSDYVSYGWMTRAARARRTATRRCAGSPCRTRRRREARPCTVRPVGGGDIDVGRSMTSRSTSPRRRIWSTNQPATVGANRPRRVAADDHSEADRGDVVQRTHRSR